MANTRKFLEILCNAEMRQCRFFAQKTIYNPRIGILSVKFENSFVCFVPGFSSGHLSSSYNHIKFCLVVKLVPHKRDSIFQINDGMMLGNHISHLFNKKDKINTNFFQFRNICKSKLLNVDNIFGDTNSLNLTVLIPRIQSLAQRKCIGRPRAHTIRCNGMYVIR